MIKEIKSIPLAALLSRLGHEPAARKGTKLWYKSPLRHEHTPSFKVETTLNCWYDFGLGKGGNIIDLAAELYHTTDLHHLMRCITDAVPLPSVRTVASISFQRHSEPSFTDISVVPLTSHAIVAYLQERGIPAHIATANCQQIHYTCRGKRYYAVAFANESGGVEMRSRYFKGCCGHKDISIRHIRDGPSTDCAVFEGFIDYLSVLVLGIIHGMDAIILNSVSCVSKAISVISDYSTVHCFLDNDTAGRNAFAKLSEAHGNTVDRSTLYAQFNDLNEFLCQREQSRACSNYAECSQESRNTQYLVSQCSTIKQNNDENR